ncbi:MAG: hypothetical protein JWM05_813 [Acidimicrobiales bacterium]|nr:hypothetical protein [Acidimicrobiales bacterium]
MDVSADLAAPCPPERLFGCVDDLARYPDWLEIVTRAEPVDAGPDGRPAWQVELRARLGPLARSKRLRMVRTRSDPPSGVTFERAELDGRQHSPWVLRADVTPTAAGSSLAMHLHYGGSLWGPVLERLLGDEIDRSRTRLLTLVAS